MSMSKVLLLSFIFILNSCGPGTTTGNPLSTVALRMEDRQPLAWIKKSWDSLIPPAQAAVSGVKFCFKRLRFKPDSTSSGSNFDLELGEVEINPSGTNLLTVAVPSGVYRRIEFDLDKECEGTIAKPSVIFDRNGTIYSSQEHITIKFEGYYEASGSGTLTLNVDLLLDALDTVTANNQIKLVLEDATATGDF